MANISEGGGGGKKGKPQKLNLRVDFTPMVDMNMLLITFFMFVTTLAKPQVMDIIMPSDVKDLKEDEQNELKASKAITVLLGADDKVYYYTGQLGEDAYNNYTSVTETDFSAKGLRALLMERNAAAVAKMKELEKEKRENRKMSEEDYKKKKDEIRNNKENQVVVIKPTDEAAFKNLVEALDEIAICSIGTYAITEPTESELFLIKNYQTKGQYALDNLAPAKK